MTGNRRDAPVTSRFAKDADQERFLEEFNEFLAPFEEAQYRELAEQWPTIQVLGVPRSGSTLLMQAISSALDVGYIDNLTATFWKAPVSGIRLSRKLLPRRNTTSFQSAFGRTTAINEPHEFGYFWFPLLGYTEMREPDDPAAHPIDWARVRLLLTNICAAFESPVAFKNFLLMWHVREMAQVLPKTCFVWIRRDPVENALSLLRMRREFLGSENQWASMRPREYAWLKDEPYWVQVAGQVFFIEQTMRRQFEQASDLHVLECDLSDLRRRPDAVLEQVCELAGAAGTDLRIAQRVVAAPPCDAVETSAEDRKKVARAMEALHAGDYAR